MNGRTRLPNRRPAVSETFDWHGVDVTITLGFDSDGAIREVFADGGKTGSDFGGLLDDAAIMMSLLLQGGCTPDRLARHLMGTDIDRAPQTIAAAIAQRLAVLERDI